MTNRRQLGILPECPSLRIASWMWWFWPVLGERVTAAVARTRFLRAGVTAPIPEPVADVAISLALRITRGKPGIIGFL